MKKTKLKNIGLLLVVLITLIVINILADNYFYRFDLTTEKRYTLSQPTQKLLENLKKDIYVNIYLSGDLPPGFEKLRKSVKEIIQEFDRHSKVKISTRFEKVNINNKKEIKRLLKRGLQPTNLNVKDKDGKLTQALIFPGMIIHDKKKEVAVNFLQNSVARSSEENLNSSIEMLEYELTNAIRLLYQKEKKKIAFVSEHHHISRIEIADISIRLAQYYEVDEIDLTTSENMNTYAVVIIMQPNEKYLEEEKYIIDQYLMNGGTIIWLIDEVRISKNELTQRQSTIATYQPNNLEDQLFTYGVRINPDLLLDAQSILIPIKTSLPKEPLKFSPAPWYYEPLLMPNPHHSITKNLNLVKAEFANSIDFVGTDSLQKTILLSTSGQTGLRKVPCLVDLSIVTQPLDKLRLNTGSKAVAVLLEGQFSSIFTGRGKFSNRPGFKPKSHPTKMVVVSDGDLIKNKVRGIGENKQIQELGYDSYTNQRFGNKEFMLNIVEYLCDDEGWSMLRNRKISIRMLDKINVKNKRLFWQILNVLVPVIFITIFAIIFQVWRKWKYGL